MDSITALLEAARGHPGWLVAASLWLFIVRMATWAANQWVKRTIIQRGEFDDMKAEYLRQLADKDRQIAEERRAHEETKARETAWIQAAFQLNQTNKVAVGKLAAEHAAGETTPS